MSYIDALYKKDEDKIYVVERDPKKGRVFVEYDARYVFYATASVAVRLVCFRLGFWPSPSLSLLLHD